MHMMNRKSLIYIILCFIYKIVLDIIYVLAVHPIYGYSGFTLNFNILKYILSFIYFVLILYLIPKNNNRVSYMVLHLHFLVMIIPMFTFYSFANQSDLFMVMIVFCFIMEVILIKQLKPINMAKIKNAKNILLALFIINTIITYVLSYRYNGVNFSALNFRNIYKIREQLNVPTLLGYLVNWQHSIINPYIILKAMYNKKYKLMSVFLFLQFILYLILPFKIIILSIPVILFIVLFLKKFNYNNISLIGLTILTLISKLFYNAGLSIMPFALITRLIYIPAQIKFQHFEVFSKIYDKLYYSEGIIGKLLGVEYKFSVPSGFVVDSIFGKGTSNSNTGYLAYAYDNAGFIGMIAMSLLFVFIMLLIDSLTKSKDKVYIFALIFLQMLTLNDGDLLTTLLTGGLFLTIIILLISEKDFDENKIIKVN